jgi:predicted metalloprotease
VHIGVVKFIVGLFPSMIENVGTFLRSTMVERCGKRNVRHFVVFNFLDGSTRNQIEIFVVFIGD